MSEQPNGPLPSARAVSFETESQPLPGRTVVLFVRMWAVAHVIHLAAANGSSLDTPWNILVVAFAIALILRPTSGRLFALMAIAQLIDMVAEMPFSPDHWMLVAFVNLAILVTMAVGRSWEIAMVGKAFPAARTIVLIAYGAAALSKYNSTFLDPVASCASAIANTASFGLASRLDAGPLWVYSVIATETAIPLLLAVPATRRHGVRLALGFHFVLSASPIFAVVDYTSALFALFLLFLPERDVDNILDTLGRVGARSAIVRDARRKPPVTAVLAFVVFGFLGYVTALVAAALLLVASELYLLAMLLTVVWTWRSSRGVRAFGRPMWVHVPVIILLLCWISLPYLGLRTTSVFTMFSSIRTEGDVGNHLFMPNLRVVDWQEDFVVVEESNDPDLASSENGKAGAPLMALRRLATDDPDLVVKGTLNGEPVTFGPEPGQTHLEPLSGWQYKFLHFRAVAASDRPFCSIS